MMPSLFVGHGSPMNAIENNTFSQTWKEIGSQFHPKAIIVISAHWMTDTTKISTLDRYRQIYDMYGFPKPLYEVKYNPPGDPTLARKIVKALPHEISIDNRWGLDHGVWSILVNMYPKADIPIVVLSTGLENTPEQQFRIGQALASFRQEDVMILASGNVVHNLAILDWEGKGGYPWADQFDQTITRALQQREFDTILKYQTIPNQTQAFYTKEHFYPLLNFIGTIQPNDTISVFNEQRINGSLSMTSYLAQ